MSQKDINKPALRNEKFAEKISTKIWLEEPSQDNPYLAKRSYCHGYDTFELLKSRSYVEILFLLFRGFLPNKDESELLEKLMILLINPGPRHPATRAAIASAVSKASTHHILPISLSCLGGERLGAAEVEKSMHFLRGSCKNDPSATIELLTAENPKPITGDWFIAPGFGSRFGGIDIMVLEMAESLCTLAGAKEALSWGSRLAKEALRFKLGWLITGLAAAAFLDLGFLPRQGAGLFQIFSSPGLLAHGLEFSNKPITAVPFISNQQYFIEPHEHD